MPPGSRNDGIGRGGRVAARCADSADDVAMAGGGSSCSKHPHALALVAACALRGQPAALYVLHAFALRARTAAPSALAAPTAPTSSPKRDPAAAAAFESTQKRAPTSSQKRDPTAAAATARVAQAVARQGIERAVLGEVVADGHVCRRLHCLAARLQAAAPAAADAAAAAWGVPRVPADVECQLASVPCPLAACRMVQQAADAGSAGGNACGDAAGGDVGSDGEEGSDWDSESGEVWMGWTGGESDDDESEGGEEGGERAESALLKSSSQHPLPPPQHPHDHATPRSQRGEPKIEGLAVGAGGAGAEGDDAVLRGFGRALSLVLAQYEAGFAQLARACVASLSASSPTAATDCSSPARSQAGSPAGPSDAVLLLAMRSRRLRAQLRRLVMLLGMDPRARETAGGGMKGHPWEDGALRGRETAGGKMEDAWSVVYQCPQMVMPSSSDQSSSGMRDMPLTPPPPHRSHTHHIHCTPHTHHADRAVAASGGSRGLRSTMALGDLSSLHPSLAAAAAATAATAAAAGSAAPAGNANPATNVTIAITRSPATPATPATPAGQFTPTSGVTSRMVAPSHLVTPSRQVIPSQMIAPSQIISPSQFDTPHFLSNQAAAGDAWSAALFLRPSKINHLLPLFLHQVSHLVVRTAQQQHILLSAPSPPIRQLASHLSSLISSLLLPHSQPFPSLPTKGERPRYNQPALASDWSIDFNLPGVARTREIVQHRLAKAELQVRKLLDALEPRSVLQHASIHGGCAVEHAWRHGEGGVEHAQERGSKGVAKGGIEGAKGATERSKEGGKDGGIRGDREGSKEGAKEGTKEGVKEGGKEGSGKGAAAGSGRRKQKGVEVQSGKHSGRQRSGQSGKQGGPGRQHSGRPGEKQSGEPGGKAGGRGAAAGRGGGHVTDEERRLVGMAVTEMDGSFDDAVHAHLLLPIRASHALVSRAAVQVLFTVGRYRDHCTALHRLFLSPHSALPSALLHALHAVVSAACHSSITPYLLPSNADWASLRSLPEQQHALSSALDTAISRACLSSLPSALGTAISSNLLAAASIPSPSTSYPLPLSAGLGQPSLATRAAACALAFISPSSLSSSSLSSSSLSSISSPPPQPMSPGLGGGGVGSVSKQLTWSPLSAHRLGAFDFVWVGYDPGWPASVVITPHLLQQYGNILTALLRLQHVQRARCDDAAAAVWGGDTLTALIRPASVVRRPKLVQHYGDMLTALLRLQHVQLATSSLTVHIKVLRSALLNPSLAPAAEAAAAAGTAVHRERYRRLCFLNVFTVRASHLVSCMLAFMSAQLQRAAQHGDQILLLGTQAEHMPPLVGLGIPWDLFSFQEAHAQFLLYCTTRCLLDARSAAIRERLDSLLQLVLDVHRSVDSARMVAPLSEFFLDDDAPIWEEVEEHVGEFNEALNERSEAREGMRRRIQLAQPCGEAGAEGRGGEGREGEGYRGRSGSDAQPGRQGVCAEPGGGGRAGFGNTVPAREEAELSMHMSMGRFQGTPHGTLGRETELDRRLEAALRSGDHTAALRVNEAIIRRESARRQRQAEWHMQLAASLQEQESARRKKRQRLNWGMDVLRKSEGKGNMSSVARADRSTGVTAATAATVVAARARLFGERFRSPGSASSVWRSAALRGHTTRRERGGRGPRGVTVTATCKPLDGRERGNFPGGGRPATGRSFGEEFRAFTESTRPRLHGARTLHPISRPHLPTFSPFPPPLPPQPHSPFLPFPHLLPPPPPLSPRSAFPRPPGDVVSRGVDRAFTELAELDKSPGSDGRQVINVPELYTGILIVYDNVNSLVPGMHISPPSKKQVVQLVQDYDINHDGVLDRKEFGELVRHFARTVVARVVLNLVVIFSLVPLLVSLAKKLTHKRSFFAPPLRSITLHHAVWTTHAAQATPAAQDTYATYATIPVTPLVFFDVVNARSSLRPLLFLPSTRTLVLSSFRVTSVTFCFRTVMIRLTCNIAKTGDSSHLFAQQKNLLSLPLHLGP
ncbi:unnamed protein product [Closterium sp. Naga37s-1]|nr:unnamed protein product [Closterium sp. Naga37s-1]